MTKELILLKIIMPYTLLVFLAIAITSGIYEIYLERKTDESIIGLVISFVIEDLDVKKMQMSKKAKNLHRSLFGQFRQMMEYKSQKFGKTLIVADRYYPSTQRCSYCGFVKSGEDKITLSGNEKHSTRHNEYICYHCGYKDDRDHNAVLNLLALAK